MSNGESAGQTPVTSWINRLTNTQILIVQGGAFSAMCVFMFLLWNSNERAHADRAADLKWYIDQNAKEIDRARADTGEVKKAAFAAAQAHGDAQREIVKLANDQRKHDASEREATRKVMEALVEQVKPRYAEPMPAPKK